MIKFLDFISSKKFRNTICFVLFAGIMTFAISSQNYFFQKIIENGISKTDIVAQKDIKVIDTQKTERLRREVAQGVEPILTQAEDDFIATSLTALQNSVVKIREKNTTDSIKQAELKVLFDESDKKNLVEFLLRASDSDLQYVFDKASITLTSVLNAGVTYKDFEDDNVAQMIKKNLPNSVTKYKGTLITEILNQIIVPNLVIDEDATEFAKKAAQNSIKPYEVIIKKGDKIVEPGDQVGRLKKDALRAAGYNIVQVNYGGILGIFILVSFFTFIFLQYEKNYEKQYYDPKYITMLATFTLVLTIVAALLPTGFSPYILPLPAYAILISIFTTPRNAFFASTIVLALLAIGMYWNLEVVVSFMLLNTVALTAVSKLKFSKRADLLVVSSKVTLAGVLVVAGIYFIEKYMMDIDNILIATDVTCVAINCFVISGLLLLGLLPMIESVFKLMTPYGLAELADYNQTLLRSLMQKAPGTFNHSLTVSYLCENAAEAIGANAVLARVGAMYHDIGKIKRPMFFIENQSFPGIENPHNNCNPRFSKMIITAHPKDGIDKAKEEDLPQAIIDFIAQHHGTTLVSYFYDKALQEEGAENVNEDQFRYPGPKPNTKETAILMLADAIESAVRAAKTPSEEEIDSIIEKIVQSRLNDGQLSDSPLTLKDLKTIKESLAKSLKGMYHKRIKYHNDLVQELDKTNNLNIEMGQSTLDKDLEIKIKELENKKNDAD